MLKKYLRKEFLAKRMLLNEVEQQQQIEKIVLRFTEIQLPELAYALSYSTIAKKNEIATTPFERIIIHQFPQCRMCYPKVRLHDYSMEAIECMEDTKMHKNEWGIPEPDGGNTVDPKQIDLILVPLLAFDKQGYRVGYGKGFYDRYIARCRPDVTTIGLSFFEPVDSIEDIDEYDIPLGYCITPEKLYKF